MNRRHQEDAFLGAFVPTDLQHNGNGFNNKQAAHDDENKFLADDDGNGAKRRTKRECTDVAHKDLCRIGVKPQKAETRATHGGTENHHFVCAGNVRQLQVLGKLGVSAGISKDGKAGGDKYNGECSQPSKPSVKLTALDVPTMVR